MVFGGAGTPVSIPTTSGLWSEAAYGVAAYRLVAL
jgi:hypothetical protein